MSGLSGGLAPLDKGKSKGPSKSNAGSFLDNIVDRKEKPSSGMTYGMDDSFDSFNSTSLASDSSLPSPSPAKGLMGAGKPAKSSPDNYFGRSQDFGDSVQDLESSTGGGYQPSSGRGVGAGVESSAEKGRGVTNNNQRDMMESSFDSSYDGSPGKRPGTTGGIMNNNSESSGVGATSRPYSADAGKSYNGNNNDGGDDLEASSGGGGGYNPTLMASGGRARQRRSLAMESIDQQQTSNVAGSLDELDRALGFGGGIASAPAVAPPAPQSRLQGYDSSDDEAYNPNIVSNPAAATQQQAPKSAIKQTTALSESLSESNTASSFSAGFKKNLSVRVDVPDSSAGPSTADSAGTMSSGGGAAAAAADSYVPNATPNRQTLRSIPSAATASSPAWLSTQSPGSGTGVRARSPKASSVNNAGGELSMADQTIRNMQQNAETAQLEREAIERQLRTEIDGLKRDLTRSNMGLSGVSDDQLKEYGEGSMRAMRETADLKRQIAQQDMELARLRDEATLKDYKHVEEIKRVKEKHADDLRDCEKRKAQDVIEVQKRHEETLSSLKRIHLEELNSVKERSKENSALDQLASQLKSATGSIKLLEEQLLSKYRGLDAAKDGQMEARERLLAEMEEKARTRVDTAESESYRLKGLLMHMEHVAGTLRGQGGEEKERLRQEHQRLHSLQLSLDAERNAFQSRVTEELTLLKKKMEECEAESRRLNQDKREQLEKLGSERRDLDGDKAEFSTYVISHTKHAEATTQQFKDEEKRLLRLKNEVERDNALLEQRKSAAAADIQEADRIRNAVNSAKEEVSREKAKLQQAVAELNTASLGLQQQGESLEKLKRVLDQREIGVREANAQMKIAASKLKHREIELNTAVKDFEGRMVVLAEQDRDLTKKRVDLAAKQREQSRSTADSAMKSNSIIIERAVRQMAPGKPSKGSSSSSKSPGVASPSSSSSSSTRDIDSESAITDWMRDFKTRLDHGRNDSTSARSGTGPSSGTVNNHILEAKRSLLMARGNLVRSGTTRQATDRILQDDSSFMSFVQGQRARAAWNSGTNGPEI